jgi:hypothetical protein
MNLKALIQKGSVIIVKDKYPKAQEDYLLKYGHLYECQICSGFHAGVILKPLSVVNHFKVYHSEVKQ